MRHNRPKQHQWGKCLKIINSKAQFDLLDKIENQFATIKQEPEKKKQTKKQDITVPKIQIVTKDKKSANEAGIPYNFIRLSLDLNLPRSDRYQLNEIDYTFLLANESHYTFGGRKVLTCQFLEKAIVELELMAGKDTSVLPRNNKTKLKAMIEKDYSFLTKMDNYEQFLDLIYNHWKGRRQDLKTPILRVLWKPNADDNSHYLAFRPRDKQKMRLRRINKPNQEENRVNMENLLRQLQEARNISERVRMRETLRMTMFNLQLQKFNQQIKQFKDEPLFIPEMSKKDIEKVKQKLTKLKNQYDYNKPNVVPEQIFYEAVVQDPHTSTVNFLATLINKTHQYGIDYDLLMGNRQSTIINKNLQVRDQTETTAVMPKIIGRPPQRDQSVNVCKFNIIKINQNNQTLLQRNFGDVKRRRSWELKNQPSNYFDERHKSICQNYFFEDDDDQGKDIRRSISINFKRWIATKKVQSV